MDIISLLPSPTFFFRLFIQAVSLCFSAFGASKRKHTSHRPPLDYYDLNSRTGPFPQKPLPPLPPYFSRWEAALSAARGKLCLGQDDRDVSAGAHAYGTRWRSDIESCPVLETDDLLHSLSSLQRAHYVLAWLVNLYVHSLPPSGDADSAILVPKSLAVPLVAVSRRLGIAPVLTFADTVLWNWELIDPEQPLSIDNMRFINLFSGTQDEHNFYSASASAELRGIEILRIIDDFNSLPNVTDITSSHKVSRQLSRLRTVVEDIGSVIRSVREKCDPHTFYWQVRPWYEGENPSGHAWVYEGVEGSDYLDLNGPSAGQSTVMHALDIFLDIDHNLRQRRRYPAPSPENRRAEAGFMERMRRYMPGKHREYLQALSTSSRSIRELAIQTPSLRDPYDAAVEALRDLRSCHIRIGCLYIVSMAKSTSMWSRCPIASKLKNDENRHARGTGGNEVTILLKAGRDATHRAMFRPTEQKFACQS